MASVAVELSKWGQTEMGIHISVSRLTSGLDYRGLFLRLEFLLY